jgi:glutamate dehydrogenase/leucine dehydrogenase
MKVIAVSDSKGSIHNRDGISVDSLRSHKLKNGTVSSFQGASSIADKEVLSLIAQCWFQQHWKIRLQNLTRER